MILPLLTVSFQIRVSTREIVVGDCVVLSTGDIICADGLVFERNTLKIFEGALTGESNAISKGAYEFQEKGNFEVRGACGIDMWLLILLLLSAALR